MHEGVILVNTAYLQITTFHEYDTYVLVCVSIGMKALNVDVNLYICIGWGYVTAEAVTASQINSKITSCHTTHAKTVKKGWC